MDGIAGGARNSKEIINAFVKSMFLAIGVYIIIALVIFSYKGIVNILTNGAQSIYPIRVNVQDTYSFNTNITGYMKYMTLVSDYVGQLTNSFKYFLVVFLNFLFFIFMFVRTWIVALLILIAPISAINYMRGHRAKSGSRVTNLLYFGNWLSFFIRIVIAPIFGIIIYRFFILILA